MGNEELLKKAIYEAVKEYGINEGDIVIEHSRDTAHGDYSTNVAMKNCKKVGKNPRDFAAELVSKISDPIIEKIEIAGPGFINFFMKEASLTGIVKKIIDEGKSYGRLERNGVKVNVEFVSANPTGDLHLGHTRIAAVGDCICNILDAAGYDVTREYYVNDCGNQVEHLGHSLSLRYKELFGESIELGDDDYHGQDLIKIAAEIKEKYGDKYLKDDKESHDFFIRYGIDAELKKILIDMEAFRVKFDKFSYESDIRKGTTIPDTIKDLTDKGLVYEQEGAQYLKTTAYLDDKDRPIVKKDGMYTYFMPDICYHYDKMSRGYSFLIDVLGADHHGYINRMKSALAMKGYSPDALEVELVQLVKTFRDGEEVKMSKRTGKSIAHRDLIEDVGVDAVRYFFVERSQTTHLDFNYNLAMEKSSSNPVYYAQYAHARCTSVLNLASEISVDETGSLLKEESEMSICKHLANFPSIIETAARDRAPYKIANYVHSLAELIHGYYAGTRIIDRSNLELTSSRLGLIKACRTVMANALALLGVSAPEKM